MGGRGGRLETIARPPSRRQNRKPAGSGRIKETRRNICMTLSSNNPITLPGGPGMEPRSDSKWILTSKDGTEHRLPPGMIFIGRQECDIIVDVSGLPLSCIVPSNLLFDLFICCTPFLSCHRFDALPHLNNYFAGSSVLFCNLTGPPSVLGHFS